MRVVMQVLLALAFAAAGVLFGAFNPDVVRVDFHVFQVPSSLGVALLVALLVGALLGGLAVTAGVVWPLQRRVRKLAREAAASQAAAIRTSPAA